MDTVQSLCERHQVDMPHAKHVAALAVRLFDEMLAVHGLDARSRVLCETGALLHNVALSVDEANHHTVGRDIVAGAKLKGFTIAERNSLACVVAFHRKAVQAADEVLFRVLTNSQQRQALVLSALVRVADGLDYSQTQTTQIDAVSRKSAGGSAATWSIGCSGPHSYDDARRATKKADLWNQLFGALVCTGRITKPGIDPNDTLAEAGRKWMRFLFAQLEVGDWGLFGLRSLLGTSQALHSALLALGHYYKSKHTEPIQAGLRMLIKHINAAYMTRQLHQSATHFAANADEDGRGLSPYTTLLAQRSQQAEENVRNYVQGTAHMKWLGAMQKFLAGKSGGKFDRFMDVDTPSRVRHAAQMLFWQHLATVRAFDVLPDHPTVSELHALQRAIRRLHDLLHGLQEVLALPSQLVSARMAQCATALSAYANLLNAQQAADDAFGYAQRQSVKAITAYVAAQQHELTVGLKCWRDAVEPLFKDTEEQ
jgi:hypothetical protein